MNFLLAGNISGFPIAVGILIAFAAFFWWYFSGKWIPIIRVPASFPREGMPVPILGVTSIFSHNTLFPRLRLYNDGLDYRILFKRKILFTQIQEARFVKPLIGWKRIALIEKDGNRLWFMMGNQENTKELLNLLKRKGVKLDQNALELIA